MRTALAIFDKICYYILVHRHKEKHMICVLYNPQASNGRGAEKAEALRPLLSEGEIAFQNVLEIEDLPAFLEALAPQDKVYLAGGDGTLNKFINLLGDHTVKNELYLYGSGSGNDFLRDVLGKDQAGPVQINRYIDDLPCVTVNGRTQRFINGIGFGIDGYCCEVGDKKRAKKPGKAVNYTAIAITGLLFHFRAPNARITVDGESKEYRRAWIAPAMKGRFYGGGMMVAPAQDRLAEDGKLSSVVFYGKGRLKTLMVFPSIFEGKHIEHPDMVDIRRGHTITVEFDRPTALQIDGETVLGVTSYTVCAKVPAKV